VAVSSYAAGACVSRHGSRNAGEMSCSARRGWLAGRDPAEAEAAAPGRRIRADTRRSSCRSGGTPCRRAGEERRAAERMRNAVPPSGRAPPTATKLVGRWRRRAAPPTGCRGQSAPDRDEARGGFGGAPRHRPGAADTAPPTGRRGQSATDRPKPTWRLLPCAGCPPAARRSNPPGCARSRPTGAPPAAARAPRSASSAPRGSSRRAPGCRTG
jgi:hypothetical protein